MKSQFKTLVFAALSGVLLAITALACSAEGEYASSGEVAAVRDRAAANESSVSQLAARVEELETGDAAELSARVAELSGEVLAAQGELERLSREMAALRENPAPVTNAGGNLRPDLTPRFSRETATDAQQMKVEEAIACIDGSYDHIADAATKATIGKAVAEAAWLGATFSQNDADLDQMVDSICNRQMGGMEGMADQSGGQPMPPFSGAPAPASTPRFDRDSATPEQQALVEATLQCNQELGRPLPPGITEAGLADLIWQAAGGTSHDDELRMMALMTCAPGAGP